MAAVFNRKAETGAADPIIQRIAQEDPVPWYKKPNLRSLYFLLFPTCMAMELTSGFDGQMVNALQIVPAWQDYFADQPDGEMSGSMRGLIAAVYWIGGIAALPFVGIINDHFGRRWSIFVGSACMVVGAIIQGFSVNVGMYIFARVVLGFGIAPASVAATALLGELGYPKERPFLTTLLGVSLYPGMILAAGICFGTNNIAGNMSWRVPSFLQAVPSLVQLALCLFIPESPRYLIARDRHDEAYAILAKYHAEGDTDSDFVKAEYAHMKATLELEMEFSKRTYLDLLRSSGMRRRTLLAVGTGLFKQWSGNTLISYFLSQILDMVGITDSIMKQKINLSLSCWSLVCAIPIVCFCVNMSRVKAAFICTISMLTVFVAWTVSMQKSLAATDAGNVNDHANIAVIVFIFLYKPAYQVFFNALVFTYQVEIWPYAERSRGLAVHKAFTLLAGAVTTFVNPIGLENIGWYFFLTYIVILVFEIIFVYLFFPETHGRTLEELAFLFEDKALAEAANDAAAKAVGGNVKHIEEVGQHKV
ncbi:sugar transporter domain-containing protein [Sarocladium implicatum]|nr:sugar transporter domain-containing protein [Sarocladium implicatum]